MRRRGNKSHKVPNVKLRPADPGYKIDSNADRYVELVQDSQADAFEGNSALGLCPRPFSGVVLCTTGVDKTMVFKKALELGATCLPNFTDVVTHLVASEDHTSTKYQVALKRKIPILTVEWVMECFDIWQRGDDVDFAESVKRHRMPIFAGVNLSLSGFTDMSKRMEINKHLQRNGGVYTKDLQRPVKITHLLCTGEVETEKMHYAKKFNDRKEATIILIWEEWFWDSLEFGGRFDEAAYQVSQPRPERQKSAPPPIPVASSSGGAADAIVPAAKPPVQNNEEDEALASIRRVPAVTHQIWAHLLKPRGLDLTAEGKIMKSPSKSQTSGSGEKDAGRSSPPSSPSPNDRRGLLTKNKSFLLNSSFRRANSFTTAEEIGSNNAKSARLPFRKTTSEMRGVGGSALLGLNRLRSTSGGQEQLVMEPVEEDESMPEAGPSRLTHSPPPSSSSGSSLGLFNLLRFRLLGEARSPSVRDAIEGGGGVVVPAEDEDEVDFIIVRIATGSKLYCNEADESEKAKYRTECWLERSMQEHRICDVHEHVAFSPIDTKLPIRGTEHLNVSLSGLEIGDRIFTERLLRGLGISFAAIFSKKSSHLLCPSGVGTKFEKSLEWGIPVVSMQWLSHLAKNGVVPPIGMYIVDGPIASKGKGKAKAEADGDVAMQDSEPLESQSMDQDLKVEEDEIPSASEPVPSQHPTSRPELPDTQPTQSQKPPIPSSATPSPMKAGSPSGIQRQTTTRVPSLSPQRPPPAPVGKDVTRKLHEDFTKLLGKRRSEDDTENMSGPEGGGGKNGKRARPTVRSNPHSRQTSLKQVTAYVNVEAFEGYADDSSVAHAGDDDKHPLVNDMSTYTANESMRVTYEDPGQRAEKERLMSMFGKEVPQGKSKSTKKRTRPGGF